MIGLLLVVFGTLLMRKLSPDASTPAAEEIARGEAQPPSSAGMDSRPAVVLPQLGLADQANSGSPHDQQPSAVDSADARNRNFMPVESAAGDSLPAEPPVADRYHQADQVAANPFVHKASAAEPAASDPPQSSNGLDLPAQQPEPVANPLRRLNKETPTRESEELTEAPRFGAEAEPAPAVDEPAAEEPLATTETPSADEAPAEPTPLDHQPAAEPARPARFAPPADLARDEEPIEPANTAPEEAPPVTAGRDWRAGGTEPRREPIEPATPPANGRYTVQPNDSLWIISEKVYGTGGYFKALREHNRATLPRGDRLVVGSVLAVPPVSTLEQNFPGLCPKQRKSALVKPRTMQASTQGRRATGSNVYVVEQGDTLFDIARYELGKASRWAEIYDLNRDVLGEDFDHLSPGTELTLPAKQGADSFTRQNDSRYQR